MTAAAGNCCSSVASSEEVEVHAAGAIGMVTNKIYSVVFSH